MPVCLFFIYIYSEIYYCIYNILYNNYIIITITYYVVRLTIVAFY